MAETSYRLDITHTGIRLAVLLTMAGMTVAGAFLIIPAIARLLNLPEAATLCVSALGGIALGLGTGWGLETLLKRVWPSGRSLLVSADGIMLHNRSAEPIHLAWSKRLNVLSWHFVIREGRAWVPRGWYCVACRLTQEDNVITLYAFMKPSQAQAMPRWASFEQLLSRKRAPKKGEEHHLKQVSEQGQLRAAEKDRWAEGVEMSPQDFISLVTDLDKRVTHWPGPVRT